MAVKNLLDASLTLDINNFATLISRDFKYQTFPKIPEFPEETGEIFQGEAHPQRREIAFEIAD